MTPETFERAIGVARSYDTKKVQAIIVISDEETYWVTEEYIPALVVGQLESIKLDVVSKMKEESGPLGEFQFTGKVM